MSALSRRAALAAPAALAFAAPATAAPVGPDAEVIRLAGEVVALQLDWHRVHYPWCYLREGAPPAIQAALDALQGAEDAARAALDDLRPTTPEGLAALLWVAVLHVTESRDGSPPESPLHRYVWTVARASGVPTLGEMMGDFGPPAPSPPPRSALAAVVGAAMRGVPAGDDDAVEAAMARARAMQLAVVEGRA